MDEHLRQFIDMTIAVRQAETDFHRFRDVALFFFFAIMPLLAIGGIGLLQVIRWVNWDPETQHARFLWVVLCCGGLAWLTLGALSLGLMW